MKQKIRIYSAILAFSLLPSCFLVSGCGPQAAETAGTRPSSVKSSSKSEIQSAAVEIARKADGRFEDGWICGRNARVLKSGYADVDPELKARFAIAYQEMLDKTGQNLANDLNSYLPYSKRAEFARKFWLDSSVSEKFKSEKIKKQVQWIYESLLDASELFFRAYELKNTENVNSAAVLAHDKEQDMVFNYMEREGHPSTFSTVYAEYLKLPGVEEVRGDSSEALSGKNRQ